MTHLVVDTHSLYWYLTRDSRLTKKAEKALDSKEVSLVVPTVVLAELKHMHRKGKINVSLQKILEILREDGRFQILPFDLDCVEQLPQMDLHDAMIVSLALVLEKNFPNGKVNIVTKDGKITEDYPQLVVW